MVVQQTPLLYDTSGGSLKISLRFGCFFSINAICSQGFSLSLALMDNIVLQTVIFFSAFVGGLAICLETLLLRGFFPVALPDLYFHWSL